MSSIRDFLGKGLLGVLAVLPLGAGCQRAYQQEVGKLNTRPLIVDGAMKRRQWAQTTVEFAAGSTPAWSTGFRRELAPDQTWLEYQVYSPLLFVGQTAIMPLALIRDQSTQMRTYRGIVLPPSWHAMPPLRQ